MRSSAIHNQRNLVTAYQVSFIEPIPAETHKELNYDPL